MSLKSYLRELLKKSSKFAFADHQSSVRISVPAGSDVFTYTPPSDGYLCMGGSQAASKSLRLSAGAEGEVAPEMGILIRDSQCEGSLFIPVTKGRTCNIRTEQSDNIWWCVFIPCLGGGISKALASLVRKGGRLCLRLKTSCAAWLNLRLAKATSLTKQSSCRFRQAHHLSTPLRQTACSSLRLSLPRREHGLMRTRWLSPDKHSELKVMSEQVLTQRRSILAFAKGKPFALMPIGQVAPRFRVDSCRAWVTPEGCFKKEVHHGFA
jgi:hypothetical protein